MLFKDTKILEFNHYQKSKKAFHNGCMIIILSGDFKKQITCLEQSTETYITFTVPTGKEVTGVDKNGEENTKNISYISQFIHSARLFGKFIIKSCQ